MATSDQPEIYRQRYETFRHLDRLRWQMLQIAVGVGSLGILAFARSGREPDWWVFAAVGPMLAMFGVAMLRIGRGINMNNQVLRKAAVTLGDDDIPLYSKWWRSVSSWISFALIGLGLVCVVLAAFRYE